MEKNRRQIPEILGLAGDLANSEHVRPVRACLVADVPQP
jgi:hypothetical protein